MTVDTKTNEKSLETLKDYDWFVRVYIYSKVNKFVKT